MKNHRYQKFMHSRTTISLGLIIALSFMALTAAALKASRTGQLLPVTVKQLPPMNGVIPVEIRSASAVLTSLNELGEWSYTVRNNTNKAITALSINESITTEKAGKKSTDRIFHTMDSFVHPDVRDIHHLKNIPPGGERIVNTSGPIGYHGELIQGTELSIDYVEFEDKTVLGPNEGGARILGFIREGAAKYKEWLVQNYAQSGRSIDAIVPLLRARSLPTELGFKSTYQNQGAKIYRMHMLDVYNTRGAAALAAYLNQ